MGENQCQLAIDALTQFFNTYSTSTPIYMELSDVPRGRALDSYIELVSVDTLPENRIHADLGYGWGLRSSPPRRPWTAICSPSPLRERNWTSRRRAFSDGITKGGCAFLSFPTPTSPTKRRRPMVRNCEKSLVESMRRIDNIRELRSTSHAVDPKRGLR